MSELSYLEKLLDGVEVEWLPLGKLGELVRGNGLPKSDFTESGVPAIHYGQIYTFYGLSTETTKSFVSHETAKKLKKVNSGDVVITNTSENFTDVGKALVYLGKEQAVTGGHATIFKPNSTIIGKYFAYFTQTDSFANEKRKYSKGTKVIDVSASDMAKIIIPIPCPDNPEKSLAIQSEIVRILDKFTELTAELTAELTMRKKQYNYYLDQSLSFKKGEVELKTLGEMGTLIRGKRFVKSDIIPKGVPCIHYGEMYTHYRIWADKAKSYISVELASKLRKASCGDVVFVSAGETIADIGRGTAWLGDEDVVIHDACFFYKSSLNPKYVAYFSRTNFFHDQIKKSISSGKISAINAKGFEKVIIPVPSPEEQARIVAFLDKFDTLTSSITEGLPREIELRQKQYEYYRDLLFSFPKPETVSN
ncbi:restriction endonuclease subunit S [Escherichia coli]|uniref:restriction endonuclease subunit S n=1 Tax=Escherichia coli TaxID=562 RepID=UPI0004D81065|nr:restriction endonuclease subunit S [Escherichia coli]EFL5685741.1 restriction endonuclease subunit S [Escherichia coli]EJG7155458.1 restriction endonuclease subunit S [Escherichia coli]KDZ19581.1 type I restriction modification DNA specificity domain protein [Escherichia coli 3-020-07_S1_C1]KDZ21189.1 type I restriction modification DNA specificity domain protein [Escherichia coli 3-020-07_S1_C2]KDZ29969.1 type I restriction modification DNA specificity domain protein [Escherichia coli 3-02